MRACVKGAAVRRCLAATQVALFVEREVGGCLAYTGAREAQPLWQQLVQRVRHRYALCARPGRVRAIYHAHKVDLGQQLLRTRGELAQVVVGADGPARARVGCKALGRRCVGARERGEQRVPRRATVKLQEEKLREARQVPPVERVQLVRCGPLARALITQRVPKLVHGAWRCAPACVGEVEGEGEPVREGGVAEGRERRLELHAVLAQHHQLVRTPL
mmetsp:Transcript_15965/g.41288  ORF Transcript_15965/g.41288 Transcript_15965/m.41288 type:complete len:218 (+) Transcript_15965:138-791(+)